MTDDQDFTQYRRLLFAIAYRMLGSVMDAEDVVQEAFTRWQARPEAEPRSPKAYLTAIVTRLCIDHLRLARVQREQYVGVWLPEPLPDEQAADPEGAALLSESVSMAFFLLLERLNPVERAVFLLHDVFAYEFAEIGRLIGRTDAGCRQIARRARARVTADRPRLPTSPEHHERLACEFAVASSTGNLADLVALLADDVTLWTDGGGKVHAPRKPVQGADLIARLLIRRGALLTVAPRRINGRPAIVMEREGRRTGVLMFDVDRDRVQSIYIVANPDKLHAVFDSESRYRCSLPGENRDGDPASSRSSAF
jgi:RNA polymerase sigma-70 factor (ECF subfamily)